MTTPDDSLKQWCEDLSERKPIPGGGAGAAVAAALASAIAQMAAIYTTGKRWEPEKEHALGCIDALHSAREELYELSEDDQKAYADLQRSWKEKLPDEEKNKIEERAMQIPWRIVEICHEAIKAVHDFIPYCNPILISDAKAGVHILAGAMRAAWQTVLINKPDDELTAKGLALLDEVQKWESIVSE